jgi:hypothetical protein
MNSLFQAIQAKDGHESSKEVSDKDQTDISIHFLLAFHQCVIETPLSSLRLSGENTLEGKRLRS